MRFGGLVPAGPDPASRPNWLANGAGGEGWIRTSVRETRADLQSAAFNHSATSPGAGRRAMWRPTMNVSTPLECHRNFLADGPSPFRFAADAPGFDSPSACRFGAGEGNRTLVVSLEGFCSTIELHPHRSGGANAIPALPPSTTPSERRAGGLRRRGCKESGWRRPARGSPAP